MIAARTAIFTLGVVAVAGLRIAHVLVLLARHLHLLLTLTTASKLSPRGIRRSFGAWLHDREAAHSCRRPHAFGDVQLF